jgi:CRP/FNR family nitrogen fixation transcriptional regulator
LAGEFPCVTQRIGKGKTLQTSQEHHPDASFARSFAKDPFKLFLRSKATGSPQEEMLRRNILALRRGPMRYRRNQVIACEGDNTEYVFLVVSGVVRRCRTFCNGTRGITAFHLPGELFGWTYDGVHALSVEAATNAIVLFIKRNALLVFAAQSTAMANFLLSHTAAELQRVQKHSLLMGRDAKFRLVSFLTDLASRTGGSSQIELPMPHQDIADYLGMKIETVSRTITGLERAGLIARRSRRTLVVNDSASLARMLN